LHLAPLANPAISFWGNDKPLNRSGFSEDESLRITELVMNYFESVIAD
jgi:hypothetical protein